MANKELSKYKSIDVTNIATRSSYDLTSAESTKVDTILTNFFSYFKTKHS